MCLSEWNTMVLIWISESLIGHSLWSDHLSQWIVNYSLLGSVVSTYSKKAVGLSPGWTIFVWNCISLTVYLLILLHHKYHHSSKTMFLTCYSRLLHILPAFFKPEPIIMATNMLANKTVKSVILQMPCSLCSFMQTFALHPTACFSVGLGRAPEVLHSLRTVLYTMAGHSTAWHLCSRDSRSGQREHRCMHAWVCEALGSRPI